MAAGKGAAVSGNKGDNGWGGSAGAKTAVRGYKLHMRTSTGADAADGGLPEGAKYFAFSFHGDACEIFMLGEPPSGGWKLNNLIPPLVIKRKDAINGELLREYVFTPMGAGVGGGLGAMLGGNEPAEIKAEPVPGDVSQHHVWIGPNGWSLYFNGEADSWFRKSDETEGA